MRLRMCETELYRAAREQTAKHNETNDCAVVAVSIATGVPYEKVLNLSYKLGRQRRCGTRRSTSEKMLQSLGFRIAKHIKGVELDHLTEAMLAEYRELGSYARRKSLTLGQVKDFPSVWEKLGTCLLFTSGHVACLKDGAVHDWAANGKRRIERIWQVEPV